MINVCKEINCPYYGENPSYGCKKYTISNHCHLLWDTEYYKDNLSTKILVFADKSIGITSNQYCLHIKKEDESSLTEIKELNEQFFSSEDEVRRLESIRKLEAK